MSDLLKGLSDLSATNLAQAADAFERVLSVDPNADMSRALAAACRWETGETNRAIALASSFKGPSGRWPQWVAIKTEIETGYKTTAAVHLAELRTSNCLMFVDSLFGEQCKWGAVQQYLWRKLDWEFYHQVSSGPK